MMTELYNEYMEQYITGVDNNINSEYWDVEQEYVTQETFIQSEQNDLNVVDPIHNSDQGYEGEQFPSEYDTFIIMINETGSTEETEKNAYGLEGEYKKDFEEWKHNYDWFGRTFQEWIQEKKEYERKLIREMAESWEDDKCDDAGKIYFCEKV